MSLLTNTRSKASGPCIWTAATPDQLSGDGPPGAAHAAITSCAVITDADGTYPEDKIRDLLDQIDEAGYLTASLLDIASRLNVPLARAIEDDVLLVHTWEGRPLPREHGGPVRMITPKLYAWKGTKWIRKIEFLARDQRGFWEVRGYSNEADPWLEQRFAPNDSRLP